MWVLKLQIRHDCTIGNRCDKFSVWSYSIPLGNWSEDEIHFTSERHTLEGNPENIKEFINDIQKDPRVTEFESSGSTMFFIGESSQQIPSSFYNQEMFFTKPVIVDTNGIELWEVASHKKTVLSKFFSNLQEQNYELLKLLAFEQVKLNDIYFPAVAPDLTAKQKDSFELAVREGYYDIPKQTDLAELANMNGVSVATFQEHLRRAEAKIIPRLHTGG